jgi:hypothetical protein
MLLKQILFEDPLGKSGNPLFQSESDLVEQIQALKSTTGDATPKSLRAFVNQVVRGKRSAPPDLEEGIREAVRSRLEGTPKPDIQSVLDRLAEAFQLLPMDPEKLPNDSAEFAEMEGEAERALVHFIVTIAPAETRTSDKANRLKSDLIRRLGLIGGNGHRQVSYIFNLPDRRIAEWLWDSLRKFLRQQLIADGKPSDDADSRLKALGDRLQVNVVDPIFCIPPMIVFNPDRDEGSAGYVLEYPKDNCVSLARLSSETLNLWKLHVYPLLTAGGKQERLRGKERITFEQFLEGERD